VSFDVELTAATVLFGAGRLNELGAVLDRAAISRGVLIDGLAHPGAVARIERLMGGAHVLTLDRVRPHVPADEARRAREQVRGAGADGLVAVGGGSATGLAKAVALTEDLPIVAIPTTYAGSEMTPIWGMTEGERKTTGRDVRVLPRAVVYDPQLTYSLPAAATAATGMNAIAHCVEALWTAQASPFSDALAEEGMRLLAAGLPAAVADRGSRAARIDCLQGAWLAGMALAAAGTALHHRLCHALGGFGLPHAEVHAAVLPAVVELFAPAAPRAMARIARALGAADAAAGLRELATALGTTATLADMGLTAEQAGTVARLTADAAPTVPRPVDAADVLRVLAAAGAPT
jgi:maleylacetate reductase